MKVIRCHSKECKGRIIGNVPDKGQAFEVNGTETSGLLSVRFRFDKNFGFQCKCGNNSLLAKQEDEIISKNVKIEGKKPTRAELNKMNIVNGRPPTRAELKEIWKNVQANPTESEKKGDHIIIEGFSIEEIK